MKPYPLLLLLSLILPLSAAQASKKPNFVFILIDDAGYDDFSYMGGKDWKTPRIDSIAHAGVNFSNDNGAATYLKTNNGGLRGRKGTAWEGGLRVPFCVSWKGHIKPGTFCDTPINTLDVASTFCKLAGYSKEEIKKLHLPGADLIELAEGSQPDRSLYWRRGNTSATIN